MDPICRVADIHLFNYIYSKYHDIININLLLDDIIRSRNINFIKYIFDNFKVDINTKEFQGYTPLHRAIFLNDKTIIDYLLQKNGIDFFTVTDYDEDLLSTAIKHKSKKIIEYLINLPNFPINKQNDSYEINPLGKAIVEGDIETVKLLLNHPKIIPNIYTFYNSQHYNYKNSHISLALENKNQKIMELLLSHPLITLTDEEKNKIIKKYPSISKEIIDSVKIREPNKYDKLKECINEDEWLDYEEDENNSGKEDKDEFNEKEEEEKQDDEENKDN